MADIRPLAVDDADSIIRSYYKNIKTGADKPLLVDLSAEEQAALEKKEAELKKEPEKRELDTQAEDDAATDRVLKKAKTNGITA